MTFTSISSFRPVTADDDSGFTFLDQEHHTNSSESKYTVTNLQPYTVYSFRVAAVNSVGRSR